jgi:eukaryotic-like serine/threonine-protein kinase
LQDLQLTNTAIDRLQAALADRYRIERELGQGGMATVYLALDLKHGRKVALKVLRPEIAQSLGAERFLREIEIVSQLQHPHILGLHDSGTIEWGSETPGLYYAMPYVEGESVRGCLERETQLSIDQALHIAREVADALDYAHRHGVVHRDIKPENILLSSDHAIVADFGIARAVTNAGGSRLTETGLALGTPYYMSPESAAGMVRIDGRSDIYALGCVLYEMLAGQPPFVGPTAQAILARHSVDPIPSLHTVRGTVPSGVEWIITKAMAKVPADRFATAGKLGEALAHPERVPELVSSGRKTVARWGYAAVMAVVLLAALIVGGHFGLLPGGTTGGRINSLAVLPIENLTGDTGQVYIADGITDQLITDLAQLRQLRVIGRTSVMRYRGSTKTAADIAGELHVDGVLGGSMQRRGDDIRVSAQLSSARTGQAVWAKSVHGSRNDILRLQSDLAESIAEAVHVELSARERTRLAAAGRRVDPAAHTAYVKGRYWWNKRGAANLKKATGLFQDALDLDPTFAPAYSGQADAYVQLGYGGYLRPENAFPKAKAAAMRALASDSSLAEPHASLGFYYLYYAWDWAKADQEFQTALALNPNYATAREWYSLYLAAVGRLDQAQAQVQRAAELDPLSVPIASTAGWIAHYSGKQEEAESRLRNALAMDSTSVIAHLYLGRVFQAQGKNEQALSEYQATGSLRNWVPTIAGMGYVDGALGRRADALRALHQLDSLTKTEYVTAYAVALVYTGLGDKNQAFAWLSRGVDERTHWLVWLNRDRRWDPLRSDPRFAALVRRVGLPQ